MAIRRSKRLKRIGANKRNSIAYVVVIALSVAVVALNLWQGERSLRGDCGTAPAPPVPDGVADGMTPELARLLHPLYRVSLRDQVFFMTGHLSAESPTGHEPGEYVSDHLSRGEMYESSLTEGILRYLRRLTKGGDVLDIGMNIGTVSVPVARLCGGCRVIGIEAAPANYRKAVANARLNGVANLETLNFAVQDMSNVTTLVIDTPKGNMAMGTVTGVEKKWRRQDQVVGARVPATTLDALRPRLRNVRVVKLDVEGSELRVMQGGLRWLSERPPCVIIVEVDKVDKTALAVLLAGKGYVMRDAQEEGIRTRTPNVVFKHNGEDCAELRDIDGEGDDGPLGPFSRQVSKTVTRKRIVKRGGKVISEELLSVEDHQWTRLNQSFSYVVSGLT